jgi:hypothetical protein
VTIGRRFINGPLREHATILAEDVRVDSGLPFLNEYLIRYREWNQKKEGPAPEPLEGQRIRMMLVPSNYMWPPKFAGKVDWVPDFATDPHGETFYLADLIQDSRPRIGQVAVSYFGARLNSTIREGDHVDVEGTLLLSQPGKWPDFWVRAHKVQQAFSVAGTISVTNK